MSAHNTDHSKFSELLPFYLNDTLSTEDRAFMDMYIAQNRQAQSELKFSKAVRGYSKNISADRAPDAGLNKILQEYRALKKRPSRLAAFRAWCFDWGLTPAFAVAATVIAVQAAILLRSATPPVGSSVSDFGAYRGFQAPGIASAPDLKVSPSPNATYANLTLLLNANQCQIIRGPDLDGALWVKAADPHANLESIAQALKKNPEIDSAVVVKEEKTP